jgi:hypothetical protein
LNNHLELFNEAAFVNLGLSPKQAKDLYEFLEDIVLEEGSQRTDKEKVLRDFYELYNPLKLNWTLLLEDVLRILKEN